jgi:hypothetical protein
VKEFSYWSSRFGPAMRFSLAAVVFSIARVQSLASPQSQRLWLSVLFAAGLAWSVYAARAWGACVALDEGGVEVRNLTGRHRFSWDGVDRFALRTKKSGQSVAVLRTIEGREITIDGIRSDLLFRLPGQTEAIESIVVELNRELVRGRW